MPKMSTSIPSLLAVAGLSIAFAVNGQGTSAVPAADRMFAEKAAAGGVAEVEAGKVAGQRAGHDKVKQFGARMVQDHSKANDELKQIASGKGLQLPSAPDAHNREMMAKMQKLSGAEFDRAYMDHMVKDHQKDVAAFEKEASSGQDPDIKAFAAKTLPTLREHLKMAEATNAEVQKAKR
jgi:putative membrane protein